MIKHFCDSCKTELRFSQEHGSTVYGTAFRAVVKAYRDGSTNVADLCNPCLATVLEHAAKTLRGPGQTG